MDQSTHVVRPASWKYIILQYIPKSRKNFLRMAKEADHPEAERKLESFLRRNHMDSFEMFDRNADEIPVASMLKGVNGPVERRMQKIYPNDPCPCGSGKKY